MSEEFSNARLARACRRLGADLIGAMGLLQHQQWTGDPTGNPSIAALYRAYSFIEEAARLADGPPPPASRRTFLTSLGGLVVLVAVFVGTLQPVGAVVGPVLAVPLSFAAGTVAYTVVGSAIVAVTGRQERARLPVPAPPRFDLWIALIDDIIVLGRPSGPRIVGHLEDARWWIVEATRVYASEQTRPA
ncbi:hypothetical protein [Dactylosporangium sp. NPDC048998]|uniref:hypothetical protein n=1 Tax=Dactylosporangium sp. NPDC048998 TaxID=3363976 RepID=UPI0037108293